MNYTAGLIPKSVILVALFPIFFSKAFSQGRPPWENPLRIAWSNDGLNFTNDAIFQDSSGVPCVVKWKGDTLACVFQWFRQPRNSATWDRIAVKTNLIIHKQALDVEIRFLTVETGKNTQQLWSEQIAG